MANKFAWFKGRTETEQAADGLYRAIIGQSRLPRFYESLGVPDTIDGRFDMIALHTFLVLRRLKRDGQPAAALAQALYDLMFADMDQNLRELGIGDMGIGRRIKSMAQMFSGRIAAYDAALDAAGETGTDSSVGLGEALRRNLYRKTDVDAEDAGVAEMAAYVRRSDRHLAGLDFADLAAGRLDFGRAAEAE